MTRRDWVLLPLIGILTMMVIAVLGEIIARRSFGESATGLEKCLVLTDAATGVRGIPNSVCREKSRESPLVEFRLNGAGYRSAVSGPKAPGTYRIVLIGSSFAMGERVPVDQILAALLPGKLQLQDGRHIEVYNQGMAYGFARNAALRMHDALAADPDLILWLLTPLDIERAEFDYTSEKLNQATVPKRRLDVAKNATLQWIRQHGGEIVSGFALRHSWYEFQSQNQFVRSFFLNSTGAGEAGFLKSELNAEWQGYLQQFETHAADIAGKARAAGIPLVVSFAPNRAQAAILSSGEWPPEFDPYRLGRELQSIATRHGAIYVDILPGFRKLPRAEHLYYPMDGHPDGNGQAVLADLVAEQLGAGAIPGMTFTTHPGVNPTDRK